jgi:hypothetical protein
LQLEDEMNIAKIALALAPCLLAAPAFGQVGMATASAGTVGCVSKETMWAYADATEANDREALRELDRGSCRMLGGASYSLVEVHNGTAKILVFKAPGAWESAQVLFTLEEMLQAAEPAAGSS